MSPKEVFEDQKIQSECKSAQEKVKMHQQKESYEKSQENYEEREKKGGKIEGMRKESRNSEIAHVKEENSEQRVIKKEVKYSFFSREVEIRKAYQYR